MEPRDADLLRQFPKQRPPLSPQHAAIFAREYERNRRGGGAMESLAQRLEGWMHAQIAHGARGGPERVLELGAGTLNHVPWEAPGLEYDVVEPFAQLYAASPEKTRIAHFFPTLEAIPAERLYSRIFSVAVLEHMVCLPWDMAQAALHLEQGGCFQAGIPTEGGCLWWFGWRCTTGVSYWLRNRLDYGVIMRHEHVNTSEEILSIVRRFFKTVTVQRFPLPYKHLSLYTSLEAREPDRERCSALLELWRAHSHQASTTLS